MAFKWIAKDPNEVLDYEHDWALTVDAGDVIVPPALAIPEAGSDVVVNSSTLNGTVQKVWLSGGTVKTAPDKITLRITTAAGRTFDEGVRLQIKER